MLFKKNSRDLLSLLLMLLAEPRRSNTPLPAKGEWLRRALNFRLKAEATRCHVATAVQPSPIPSSFRAAACRRR
jgi:hypothetical protein